MKRWLRVSAVLIVVAAASAAAQAQTISIRIATFATGTSPWADAMRKFAQEAATRSQGRIKVTVYTDAQLGDIPQMFSSMQLGALDMAYFDLGAAAVLKAAAPLNVVYVPYLFKSPVAAEKVLNSDEIRNIYDSVASATGIRIFAVYGDRSPRAIETVRGPIMRPEDLKGMRMRVPSIPLLQATFTALGVQTVPLGMTEIYTALSRGMIDGQDNGFDLAAPMRFLEVAKYWSATDMSYACTAWYVADRIWKRLTLEDRDILVQSAQQGGQVATDETRTLDEQSIAALRQAGGTYVVPDRTAFAAAVANVYKPMEGKLWPAGLVEKIKAMQMQP